LSTHRPQELDSAARRRFVKRIYIPLPDLPARQTIISNLLTDQKHTLIHSDIEHICTLTDGFSGADMHSLCHDAALGPIRDIHDIELLSSEEVEDIFLHIFTFSFSQIGTWYIS
jgi:SpoVK/Ycf46/Vps4 family AAA+-type ATPase